VALRERIISFWNWFRNLGTQHHVFISIQFVVGLLCLILSFHLPPPGWSVAILAFAAAAMSVHGDMRGWQKAVWMLLLGVLLIVEIRSISEERREAQRQFSERQQEQNKEFAATTSGLKTAISEIQQTLAATDQTLQQTRAHSAVRFDRFEFVNAPSQIGPNKEYAFNYFYVNAGTETASNVDILAKVYDLALRMRSS
jgi:hypothetical protein